MTSASQTRSARSGRPTFRKAMSRSSASSGSTSPSQNRRTDGTSSRTPKFSRRGPWLDFIPRKADGGAAVGCNGLFGLARCLLLLVAELPCFFQELLPQLIRSSECLARAHGKILIDSAASQLEVALRLGFVLRSLCFALLRAQAGLRGQISVGRRLLLLLPKQDPPQGYEGNHR